jgi:imidazolonepropionase-like amidohydrolase
MAMVKTGDEPSGGRARRPRSAFLVVIVSAAVCLSLRSAAFAQDPALSAPQQPTVFQNVSLVSMVDDRVEIGRTLLVRNGRIAAIGATADIAIPAGARVVDGTGRFLMPGLTDAHVHFEAWQGFRPAFGDAPLYLAHGITTVVNLRGTPALFDWKRRVERGELLGPTIYTTGEFLIGPDGPVLYRKSGELVVGPNVTTPDDVAREVASQVQQGADLIKFYGGLSRPAYLKLAESARQAGLPVVGHRPINLDFDAVLEARQALAHMHMLTNLYFFPLSSHLPVLVANALALFGLVLIAASSGASALMKRRRPMPARSPGSARLRALTGWLLLAALVMLLVQMDVFLANYLQPDVLLLVFSALTLFVLVVTVALAAAGVGLWRDRDAPAMTRLRALLTAVAGFVLLVALASFWVPASWRSTDAGVERLARQLHDAGIPVETTLVAFGVLTSGPDQLRAMQRNPGMDYLAPAIRDAWRQLPTRFTPVVPPSALDFMKHVTGRLHRGGVRLIAGTDALGAPLIVPGASLHDELQLLSECGLSPYDVLRTATTNPATFLRRDQEFGTIAVGKRADLLLVDGNPFQDLRVVRRPAGVMVRGRWLTREELDQMLAALVNKP